MACRPGEGHYEHAWRALEKFKEDGKAKAIGVSNFGVRDLDYLAAHSTEQPSVNQVGFQSVLQLPRCPTDTKAYKHACRLRFTRI